MIDKKSCETQQKEREMQLIFPVMVLLGNNTCELTKLNTRRPDFGLKYCDKYIGIEVTEIRPHKKLNNGNIDLNQIHIEIEKILRNRLLNNYIQAFSIEVKLNENVYLDKIDKNDQNLIKEIDDHLTGQPISNKYIDYIRLQQLKDLQGVNHYISNDRISINFVWEGFSVKVKNYIIEEAITKKEDLYNDYINENKDTFDEMWLIITMPWEEHTYSFKGVVMSPNFESKYDRIYVSQITPPFANCIYSKS